MPDRGMLSLDNLEGKPLLGSDGDKLGTIADVYFDNDTQEPEWALVHTGLFGTKSTFVPITQATSAGNGIQVPYTKDQVKDAPRLDDDGELSQDEEDLLSRHYGLSYSEARSDSGLPSGGTTTGVERNVDVAGDRETVGRDTSGPTTDDAMTRSEERLRVGVTRRPSGLARLRKRVVTENVSETVPVTREEVRLEREPITDGNIDRAMSGPDISEEEHEVTLTSEEVVVDKEVVPVERVRLAKEQVTEQRTVNDTVRKEEIELEQDAGRVTDGDLGDRRR